MNITLREIAIGLFIALMIVAGAITFFIHKANVNNSDKYENEVFSTKSECNPNYSECVSNVSYDLDCKDIRKRVEIIGKDVYNLDADGDNIGCESYR